MTIKNIISDQNKRSPLKFLCMGVTALLMTSGCADNLSQFSGVEQQTRNQVEMVRIPHDIQFAANVAELSGREIAKLHNFLAEANVKYGDEFSMDFPLERDGTLSDLDQQRLQYMANLLKDSGLHMATTITPYGMEPRPDNGRLLVSKYVVTPPECGDWTQKSYPNYQNASLNNLGCANQANLGVMIANPRDLITGSDGAPASAERSAIAVERYRTKTVTVSQETTGSSED